MAEKSFRPYLTHADECHHAASDAIVDILQEANAKYVYGVTATPFRGDGLEKIRELLQYKFFPLLQHYERQSRE